MNETQINELFRPTEMLFNSIGVIFILFIIFGIIYAVYKLLSE